MTNPYQAPRAPVALELSTTAIGEGYTPRMLADLRDTRPWVRFFAVLFMFASGMLLIAGLVMPFAAPSNGTLIGFVLIGIAMFNMLPALFLQRYASAIMRLSSSGASLAFEEALLAQRGIWRSLAISIIMVAAMAALVALISNA